MKKAKLVKKTVKRESRKVLRAECLTVTQGAQKFYLTSFPAKELMKVVSVDRRDPDTDEGYQRHFSPSRVKAISKFFTDGNAIPNAVVITFDNATVVDGKITVRGTKDAGWVIDGQHRLKGAAEAGIPVEIPVVAFIDLAIEQQINHFITINREAKGVPSSLYIDLLRKLPRTKSSDEIAQERVANIAHFLNTDEESLLYGKLVVVSAPKRGEISLTNFARKAKSLFIPNRGLLSDYQIEVQQKILSNYFNAIAHAFPDEFDRDMPILFQTIGFGAFMNVFPNVFQKVFAATKGGFELKDVISFFEQLGPLGFDSWREGGTGTAAELAAAKDIEVAILQASKRTGQSSGIRV